MCGKLFLIGMPGSGKTTLARLLAQHLQCPLCDMDEIIVAKNRCSIADIFRQHGESFFRDLEHETLMSLHTLQESLVVSTGGGVMLREDNRAILQQQKWVVYLHCNPIFLHQRTAHDVNRPLLQTENPLSTLQQLYEKRDALYRQVAGFVVDVEGQTPSQTIAQILAWIELPQTV